jgi:tetratricopeptide (TPR) repeat protein
MGSMTEADISLDGTPDTPAAEQAAPDDVMAAITRAQHFALDGDRDAARRAFEELWQQIAPEGDPLHRVTLAHYMADLQDDPSDELEWDLRALTAADPLTDERAQRYHASLSVRGFYASLHLNLADDYAKLGRIEPAREHLARAEQADADLPADGYGNLIRSGIARLRERLAP